MEIVVSLGAISLPERANAGVSQPDVTDQRDPWRLHNDAASIIVMPPLAPKVKSKANRFNALHITARCCWSLG